MGATGGLLRWHGRTRAFDQKKYRPQTAAGETLTNQWESVEIGKGRNRTGVVLECSLFNRDHFTPAYAVAVRGERAAWRQQWAGGLDSADVAGAIW